MRAADAILRSACGRRFTAAVLRVELGGHCIFENAYGAVDDEGGARIDPATRFDLASLTKVFVSTAALRAVAAGRVELDGDLRSLVPEWREREHGRITVRRLLAHDAGLQSGADYRTLLGESVEAYALERPLGGAGWRTGHLQRSWLHRAGRRIGAARTLSL